MNKPSCGTCRWWESPPFEISDWSKCNRADIIPWGKDTGSLLYVESNHDSDAELVTHEDFHCAHWEDKERDG